MGYDVDDGREFFEASAVAFGEDLPVLEVCDAVLDGSADTRQRLVVLFFPLFSWQVGFLLEWRDRGGGRVGGVGNPRGLCLGKEVTPDHTLTAADPLPTETTNWLNLIHQATTH